MGAGTGGTTSIVLPALQPWREHLAEYCYTDLSKAFLIHARQTYGAANPFLTYQLWDVEQPPEAQGLERGAYDIVIAANVLHATSRMRRTVRHAKTVLRCGGILVMNEISDRSLFSHLTFGLLKGWWLYEDPELRIPGTPALAPESWAGLLGEAGFCDVAFPAACAHCLGQQIIVAQSDGLVSPPAEEGAGQGSGNPQPRVGRGEDNNAGVAGDSGGRDALIALARNGLARTLQLDPERIAADQPFADYGIDSILGVGFVGHLGEVLGAELNTALLFDYPTLESLVGYLLGQYPAESARLAGAGGDRPALAKAAGPTAYLDPVISAGAECAYREAIAARVAAGLAGALQLDPAQIDYEQPFSDYGLDSILGAGLVDDLGRVLGVELSAAILFDYPTVATLSAYIADNLYTAMPLSPNGLDHAVSASNNVRGQSRSIEIKPPFADQLEDLFLSGKLSIDSLLNIVSPGVAETREVSI
ncbi:phosphopantetheine-binding protein [Ralstonia solanacearum]|uniref:phosphopantetheine-binding protein n=1 Tax=Ralstonia solanacearum TaxID=305 RepID=UPI00399D7739